MRKLKFLIIPLTALFLGLMVGCRQTQCEHDYGDWRETVAATCEKDGVKKRTCIFCGYVDAVTIDKLGHDYEETLLSEPTCTEEGVKQFVCRNDPSHAYSEPLPALGHDWENGIILKEATCTQDGLSVSAKCRRCSISKEKVVIPALGHDFSGPAEVREATCTQKGEKVLRCKNGCGEEKSEEIPALGHDFSGPPEVREATCTQKGEKILRCKNGCGKTQTEEFPALGHKIQGNEQIVSEPTCTQAGRKKGHCERCQRDIEAEIPALGHILADGADALIPATCTKGGRMKIDCSRCGLVAEVELPALGHLYPEEFTVDSPAECLAAGHEIKKCMREGCGVTLSERMTRPLGHAWGEGTEEDSPCGGTVTTYHCTREGCDGVKQESSYGSRHEFGPYRVVSDTGCLNGYYSEHRCTVCGLTETTHFSHLLGHEWGTSYIIGAQPTQTSDGYKYLACKTCGAEKSGSRVTLPRYTLGREMKFEITLVRAYNLPFTGEGVVHVLDEDGEEVFTGNTENGSIAFSLPAKDYKVKVTDLPKGFSVEDYQLSPSGAFLRMEVGGSIQEGEKPSGEKYNVGDLIYDMEFESYAGVTYNVKELLKTYKAVILNFYYTTCPNCNEEFPIMKEVLKEYGEDVVVVFINAWDESKSKVDDHANRYGLQDQIIAKTFLISDFVGGNDWGYPTTLVIDSQGIISEMIAGAMRGDTFQNLVEKYIEIAKINGWKKS